MLKPMLGRLVVLSMIAIPAAAQDTPSPFMARKQDPVQMAAMMASSQRTMKPASFVIGHKDELALTPEQLKQLDLLVRAEEDSVVRRQIRMSALMDEMVRKKQEAFSEPQTGWDGAISEQRLREEACESAGMQVELMLNLLHDRRAVGIILTGKQIDRVKQLELDDLMRAMKSTQP